MLVSRIHGAPLSGGVTGTLLSHDEAKTVLIAVGVDADELLGGAAGRALVPEPALTTLVDAAAGAEARLDALGRGVDEAKGDAALVDHKSREKPVRSVGGDTGHDDVCHRQQTWVGGRVDGEQAGRDNGHGGELRDREHILERRWLAERDVDWRAVAGAVLLQPAGDEVKVDDVVGVDADTGVADGVNDLLLALVDSVEDEDKARVGGLGLKGFQLVAGGENTRGAGIEEGEDIGGGDEGGDIDGEGVAVEVCREVGEGGGEVFWGDGDKDVIEDGEGVFGEAGGRGSRAEGVNCGDQGDGHCGGVWEG